MPELPPWAWEALGRGSFAASLLLAVAVAWLVREIGALRKELTAAYQARIDSAERAHAVLEKTALAQQEGAYATREQIALMKEWGQDLSEVRDMVRDLRPTRRVS